jgi:hypothetical protein
MGASISSIVYVRPSGRFEETHRAKLKRAAECLTSPAPGWLIKVLSHFSFDVKTQHHVDASSPTRKERLETNASANEDVRRLLEFLQKPFATEFLAAHSQQSEALRHQLEPLLLESHCDKAVQAGHCNAETHSTHGALGRELDWCAGHCTS